MSEIVFSGEESARFTRFGLQCLNLTASIDLRVAGREPLTSRPVRLHGTVVGGKLDGYMRYLIVRESGSELEYWIAGSNATRSIAAMTVQFSLGTDLKNSLLALVDTGVYVPGMMRQATAASEKWVDFEGCLDARDETRLLRLLHLQDYDADPEFSREVALGIRAFAAVATRRRSLQRLTEKHLLTNLLRSKDDETRIAIVEDLGYVGSPSSLSALGRLLLDVDEHDHVRWAASVAMGRLNIQDAVPFLEAGSRSHHMWTRAASLLGLARKAEEQDRSRLEPIFFAAVSDTDSVIQRYACLGLSKFASVDDPTLVQLTDLLARTDSPISVRGYAALALSSVISGCTELSRQRIEEVLLGLEIDIDTEPSDPETIWGLEFLAELATLLELHQQANELYSELVELFDDWRGPYYSALSLYERGEAAITESADGLVYYRQALDKLRAIKTDQPDAIAAVSFRTDIVRGRLSLQQALKDWEGTFDPNQLDNLAEHLQSVASVFARYSHPVPVQEGVKRLSEREREYLNDTRRLVEVMSNVVALDATWRRGGASAGSMRALVRNLSDVLRVLSEQFRDQSTRGPLSLARAASTSVNATLDVLEDAELPASTHERSVQALTGELQLLFRSSTWPMPARACPIGGLGRGTLTLVTEDIPGRGTQTEPLRFRVNVPPVINVVAEIMEMAPGGATRARLHCDIAGQRLSQPIHAVEGPVRCDFLLPELSPLSSTVCRLELVFEARDCSQTAARMEVFVRRQDSNLRVHREM